MKKNVKETKALILSNQRVKGLYHRIRFLCPDLARAARPGQFLMLRVREGCDPLLRRPFSLARIQRPSAPRRKKTREGGVLEIWYKVVGQGTSLMTKLRKGQHAEILGPLGNGFRTAEGQRTAVLVGGGIGVAPLLSLAEEFSREKNNSLNPGKEARETVVLVGARSQEDILGIPEFKRMGFHPQISTEDGSLGIQGLATDLLERVLLTHEPQGIAVYACGPWGMLSRVAEISQQFDLSCQVLLESRMACGLGACLGCAVELKEAPLRGGAEPPSTVEGRGRDISMDRQEEIGNARSEEQGAAEREGSGSCRYALTCKEGPVFDARTVVWESRNL